VIRSLDQITAVGHRMVHGGERFAKSVEITDEAMAVFRELVDLAPLHNPPNILGVETGRALLPAVKHIAVMDTAWHQTMPDYAWLYALPYEWYERYGVRRYGFHGTSLLYVSRRAAVLLNRDPFACNLVLAHIGNGVSCNAVRLGVSCDTSMGLTPLEGLVMGTRAGDHDPAIDLYIMEKQGLSPAEMRALLNKKSGLLGITGSYIDRRDVMAGMARGEERARLAFEIETYRLRKYIGAYAAAMGRTDAIVFTAGVGEMGAEVRAKALEGLACMGVKLDPELNRLARSRYAEMEISTPDSDVKVYVIPTDEERVFIEDVVSFFERAPSGKARFTYRFQSPQYRNRLRDDAFAGECRKNPELRKAAALITEGCLR
jgi:acetate kinase